MANIAAKMLKYCENYRVVEKLTLKEQQFSLLTKKKIKHFLAKNFPHRETNNTCQFFTKRVIF